MEFSKYLDYYKIFQNYQVSKYGFMSLPEDLLSCLLLVENSVVGFLMSLCVFYDNFKSNVVCSNWNGIMKPVDVSCGPGLLGFVELDQ